jgi:hypothetical protein
MLHAAHGPTAGALHEAPVSILDLAAFRLDFSEAMDEPHIRNAAMIAMQYDFFKMTSRVECSSRLLQHLLNLC